MKLFRKRRKRSPLKIMKQKAWAAFSEYIRKKYATNDGYVDCVTCRRVLPWKQMQAGHFIGGRTNSILFDERCVHPQCYRCNCELSGNIVEYFRFMQTKYGDEVIDDLRFRRNQSKKMSLENYEDIYLEYTTRNKDFNF